MKKPRKTKRPPKMLWVLFTAEGKFWDTYQSKEEAENDVYGPVFRPKHTIRAYQLVPRKEEPTT